MASETSVVQDGLRLQRSALTVVSEKMPPHSWLRVVTHCLPASPWKTGPEGFSAPRAGVVSSHKRSSRAFLSAGTEARWRTWGSGLQGFSLSRQPLKPERA